MMLDSAVMQASPVPTSALLALLLWRRVFRVLPIFVAYVAYSLFTELADLMLPNVGRGHILLWGVAVTFGTLFYLSVLLELGTRVFDFNEVSPLPEALVLLMFAVICVPIWLLAPSPSRPGLTLASQLGFRAVQWTAILEMAGILTIVWLTSLQKMDWPERELRLVMGMGAWALMQLCVLIVHEHGLIGPGYHWLDLLTPIAVISASLYWVHYFWLDPSSGVDCRLDAAARILLREKSDAGNADNFGGHFAKRTALRVRADESRIH